MSGQVLELLVFAGIAFFIISKLFSVLGSSSDDDSSKNKSFFGENAENGLKDVTYTGNAAEVLRPKFFSVDRSDLNAFVLPEHFETVRAGLKDLMEKIPSFSLSHFVGGAKSAFQMIVEAALRGDDAQLEELIDKRYIDHFRKDIAPNYGDFIEKTDKLSAFVSEIYVFGNNVFIKVLFTGNDVSKNISKLHEEWSFTKSALSTNQAWYVTNIDRDNTLSII